MIHAILESRCLSEPVEPSLSTMTSEMLKLLEHNAQALANGYFILIEGSRIDHGAHVNDPVAMVRDALEFDQAVAVVKSRVESRKNTALISAADHGTGGLTLGKAGVYAWEPQVLVPVEMSTEWMGKILTLTLRGCFQDFPQDPTNCCEGQILPQIRHLLAQVAHIETLEPVHVSWIKTQVQEIVDTFLNNKRGERWISQSWNTYELERALGWIISDVARVAWTTGGHIGTDVNLYCYGPKALERMCQGVHENTFVNFIIQTYLVLDVQSETLRLRLLAQARDGAKENVVATSSPVMRRYHSGL